MTCPVQASRSATSFSEDGPGGSQPLTASRPELLVDGTDAMFREMVHAFFAFLARHEAIRAGHGKYIGLGGIEYTILISISHLGSAGEAVSINRLVSHLYLSGAFVTTVVNRLVSAGLVEKKPDPEDRRKVRLSQTPKAKDLLARLAPTQRQVNDIQFEVLQSGDVERMLYLLRGLIEGGDKALKLQEYLQSSSVQDV